MSDFDKKTNYLSASAEVSIIPITPTDGDKIPEEQLPDSLPVLALRNAVIFPGTAFPVIVGRKKSKRLIEYASQHNSLIAAVPQQNLLEEDPKAEDLCKFGITARILKTFELPDGTISAIIQGFKRIEIDSIVAYDPFISARVHYADETRPDAESLEMRTQLEILKKELKESAINILKASGTANKESITAIRHFDDNFSFVVNFIATTIQIEDFQSKVKLIETSDILERAIKLLSALKKEEEFIKLKQEINSKVRSDMDQQQREYFLNNQLRTIQEELGIDESQDIENFKREAEKKKWPKEIKEYFLKELTKLERYNPSSPDYSILYNYLQFMIELPWDHTSKDNLDLKHAQKVLDSDHFGLDKVKDRIIEYLAVLKLKGNMKSPILCLYGPPGVGKTSLGKSIAKALGREYIRIALGGMHDEAEIRGHRKTYIGAMPGRILAGIQKAGTSNPVIVLDEIDKLNSDFKSDPSSALLEALDPEQNTSFHDNYLDKDYDLSKVLFITTANTLSTIQAPLLDRLELINVSGYIAEEKAEIAKKFLLPKQLEEHGLDKKALKIDNTAINKIIEDYTRESGVRGLDKNIAKIARLTAKKIAMEEKYPKTIKQEHLKEYLGLPIAQHDKQEGNEGVGIVTGLAWTSVGGEVLFVESSVSKGKGLLSITGNLGDVMKESATIAYKYIKAQPEIAKLSPEEFAEKDIHIHVPEGAVPKDGPSAGITLLSSMVSALRNQEIKSHIAMTGEITLRGKVLPVGGIKEKILAAKRAGVKTILLSEDNRKDIEDVKEIYLEGLDFHYVKNANDVINFIFE